MLDRPAKSRPLTSSLRKQALDRYVLLALGPPDPAPSDYAVFADALRFHLNHLRLSDILDLIHDLECEAHS
jgi:hypothetical protein